MGRVNCIDCLDRTNVVQGYLARHQMETVLKLLGCLPPTGSLPVDMPKVRWGLTSQASSIPWAAVGVLTWHCPSQHPPPTVLCKEPLAWLAHGASQQAQALPHAVAAPPKVGQGSTVHSRV